MKTLVVSYQIWFFFVLSNIIRLVIFILFWFVCFLPHNVPSSCSSYLLLKVSSCQFGFEFEGKPALRNHSTIQNDPQFYYGK